jgi:uncharacterized membrane protein YphA (DoxX/SURF4 family)
MASKTRTDWSLLILRVAVALAFIAAAWPQVRLGSTAPTFANALHWGQVIGQLLGAGLLLIGLWVPLACLPLLLIQGWPVAHALIHGVSPLALHLRLLLFLATLACAVGGPGKWGVGKG